MHMLPTAVVLGSLASGALAAAEFFILPRAVLLERQSSSPVYQCHANCGYAIVNATGGTAYCKDASWVQLLDGCLDCALQYNIWNDYSSGVTAAAKACGLDATPKPAAGTTTAAQATQAPSSAVVEPTTAAGTVAPVSSTPVSSVAAPTSATGAPSHALTTSSAHTNNTAATTASAKPTSVTVSGGSRIQYSGAIAAGLAALLVAGLM